MISYLIRTVIIVLVATPVYLVIRQPWKHKDKREIALAVFFIYLLCLLIFTLEGDYASPSEMLHRAAVRVQTGRNVNFVPFKMISGFFMLKSVDSFLINVVSNIVIFVPWGFLLPCICEKFRKIYLLLPMCLAITVFIETAQLFICRSTDVDDIILNFIGGILGGVIYMIYQKAALKHG